MSVILLLLGHLVWVPVFGVAVRIDPYLDVVRSQCMVCGWKSFEDLRNTTQNNMIKKRQKTMYDM